MNHAFAQTCILVCVRCRRSPTCTLHALRCMFVNAASGKTISGRVTGVLNGLNNTLPASSTIAPLGLSMWRGPIASWLWPDRSLCKDLNFGVPGCCDVSGCAPPFSEAARLHSLGFRQQYILNGIHYGQTACEWVSFNRKPHS